MGMQIKILASSNEPTQLSSDPSLGFFGLAGVTNEDLSVDAKILHSPGATPASVNEVWRGGSLLAAGFAMQYQVQDMSTGNTPTAYWLAALPFGPMPGDTIPIRSYCATPQNSACTFVAATATIPALNNTAQVTVLDTSGFAVGNYVDRATNAGVFCGGRFWDIVSIDDSTTMTLRLRDVFGAVVIMFG